MVDRIPIRHTDKTWRLIAYIREMADLGCGGSETARMLGVSENLVGVLASQHGISFTENRRESALRRRIRDGYAAGKSPQEIAYDTGSTAASVKVIASRLGLTRNTSRDPAKHRRGYMIPADRMDEYKALRKLCLTFRECGYEMGLLQRPAARPIYAHQISSMMTGA